MAKFNNPLANVRIASPCSANWDEMVGDERKRFCGQCKLNVYNLSGMNKAEAERLLSNSEGRLCVRFYRRADGSVLTQDCPVGWRAIKRRASQFATATFSLFAAVLGGIGFNSAFTQSSSNKNSWLAFSTPKPTPPPLMGAVAPSTPKPTPKSTPKKSDEPIMGKVRVEPSPELEPLMGEVALPREITKKTKRH